MSELPDYSEEWLSVLTDVEVKHWRLKPQSERDWWAFNVRLKDRAQVIRTEIKAREVHKKLLDLSEIEHLSVLNRLKQRADAARERLEKLDSDSEKC